jgi:MFS family permease
VNRNVWLLFLCQALVNAISIMQVAMSALIGYSLASDKTMATVPYALQMVGTMISAIPAGMVFARFGRRAGFLFGATASLIGMVLFGLGVWQESFWLYAAGSIPMGMGVGIGQQYRFAAAEVAAPAQRPRAIALVMAGGVLAGVFGPELLKHTKDMFLPVLFLGAYAAMALLPAAMMVLLAFTNMAPPPPRHAAAPVRIVDLIRRPSFVTAVIAALVGYGTMNLIMASTPLEMMMCGFSVGQSSDVIRAHFIAMYAPGFVTGRLIQRFGAHRVILAGGLLNLVCASLAFAGSTYIGFMTALTLLGIGWNFMFIGATALLATAHDARERVRVQAANDFTVFTTTSITAFASGWLHGAVGWLAVNMAVILPLLGAMALVQWHARRPLGAVAVQRSA